MADHPKAVSSKPLPETEALVLPEWEGNQDAVSWYVQFRKVLKSIIYRYCEAIQKVVILQNTTALLQTLLILLPNSAILVFLLPAKDGIMASALY
jgi:hypothetical protein